MSEYECREVARFVLVSWPEWLELDENERAMCVAHYRVHSAIEANVGDAHSKYLERQSRQQSRGRR